MSMKLERDVITLKAYAKINLFLQVGKKDEKGYHLLKTVFQPLDLYDEIIIKETKDKGIKLTSNENIPLNEKNSVYKAIIKICEKTKLKIDEINYQIHIEKKIPIASGLGGSAVDAVPVIKFINERFKLGLKEEEMLEIGAEIGADVPQGMYRNATYAERYGDKIIEQYNLPNRYVSIYIPHGYMAEYPSKTETLYNMIDKEKEKLGPNYDKALMARLCLMKKELTKGNWKGIGDLAYNDFELVVFKMYPILDKVKKCFKEAGAECALLSGSGGAVFGIYKTPRESLNASQQVESLVGRNSGIFILTETS
ncbi:MAG: 4-(cytidine 5'-diphospho)-2-C-methyl-D-erythritol kinase [Candidatus Micrarchaeia archaeon]